MFSFRDEGFSCSLDKKDFKKCLLYIFFLKFLVIKTLDPDWIRIHLKCWIQ